VEVVVGGLVVAPVGCHSHLLDSIEQSVYPFLRRTGWRAIVDFVSASKGEQWRGKGITTENILVGIHPSRAIGSGSCVVSVSTEPVNRTIDHTAGSWFQSLRMGGGYRRNRTESCTEWEGWWRNSWEARGGTRRRADIGRTIGYSSTSGHQENCVLLLPLFVLDRRKSKKSTGPKSNHHNAKQVAN